MEITQNEEGIIVNNKFCFTTKTEKQADYVTLGLICGEDVIYGTVQKNFINYP